MKITALHFARLFKHVFCVNETIKEIENNLIQDMNLSPVFVVTEKTNFEPYFNSFLSTCNVVPPTGTTTICIAIGTMGNGCDHLTIAVNEKIFGYNDSAHIICPCCPCDAVIKLKTHT